MKETLLKQMRDTARSGDTASITDEFKPWETMGDGFTLEVSLFKTSYVLAWSQFIYAEGDQEKVRAICKHHNNTTGLLLGNSLAPYSALLRLYIAAHASTMRNALQPWPVVLL